MGDPITNRVEQLLTHSERGLVAIEDLYSTLANEGWMAWFDLDTFTQLLAGDERFEILEGLGGAELLDETVVSELAERGLLGGPRVMLHERRAAPETVMQDVLEQLRYMNAALESAWNARPGDDPAIEAELVNLLMMGDLLERELIQALTGERLFDEAEAEFAAESGQG